MPLRLDIKKKLSARSDRVKCVDMHLSEPWCLASLYSGNCFIWDYNTQSLLKQFEVCNLPVRCAKFISRKQWVVTASDDMNMCVFNYNTLEKVHSIEAHADYIRYLAVHPTQSYVLSASDDMTIKLWDWDKNWTSTHSFEGHAHYVMMCQWNPKDTHIFASASLDRTIKIWGVGITGNQSAHFTLSGHTKGVNCLDYSPSGEKPYIVSGSDDHSIRVWDYQTKQCIQVLTGHTNNITTTVFHPTLPVILTGSEDGTVKVWHTSTYRLEVTLNYLLERTWSIHCMKGSNNVAIGYDEGTIVIKMGSEEPVASMTSGGKIVWAKGNEIQTANLKLTDDSTISDGERLQLSIKDMGASEIFPQSIHHHPNGRLFAVCGDGEYVVYTAQVLRNKVFGQAVEFVWSWEGHYAIRDAAGKVSVFSNFKESFSFKPPFTVDEMFGGRLLGIKSQDFICFYAWDEFAHVRRIDVSPNHIYWSDTGENVVLACPDSFFLLGHDHKYLAEALATKAPNVDDEGYEQAFSLKQEVSSDKISSALWIGDDCFVYCTVKSQRMQYLSAGQTELIAHLDRPLHLLGYMQESSKLFLIDKDYSVVGYSLHMDLIEYQSCIIRKDLDAARTFLARLPESLHNRVARFLEHQHYLAEALEISKDADHKFELALQLGKLQLAHDIINTMSQTEEGTTTIRAKWRQLGDVALEQGDFVLADKCFIHGRDYSSMFLLQISAGDANGLLKTAEMAQKERKYNIAVQCYLLIQENIKALDALVEAKRYPEAAFFSRTYCPSQLSRIVQLWKQDLRQVNEQMADSLADPSEHPDLFPGYVESLKAEEIMRKKKLSSVPATRYASLKETLEFDTITELEKLGPQGFEKFWGGIVGTGRGGNSPVSTHSAPKSFTPIPRQSDRSQGQAPSPVSASPQPQATTTRTSDHSSQRSQRSQEQQQTPIISQNQPETTSAVFSNPEDALEPGDLLDLS